MKNPDTNTTRILTSIACLVPIIPGLLLWDQLPDQLVIHWNAAGEPDSYGPKALVVFGFPLLMCGLNLFLQGMQKNDPQIGNAPRSLRLLSIWIIPVLSLILVPVTLLSGIGVEMPVTVIISLLLGIIFIGVGNYLPKSKQNSSFGIRLPWTLAHEENWNRTHHLAGYLWILGGGLLILGAFLPSSGFLPILVVVLILITGIPFAYSYMLNKKGV